MSVHRENVSKDKQGFIERVFDCFGQDLRPAMSNPRAACGPDEGFVRCSVGFRCSKSILNTCPYFDNLEFDIFVAGGPQCHFNMFVTIAGGTRTLSGH